MVRVTGDYISSLGSNINFIGLFPISPVDLAGLHKHTLSFSPSAGTCVICSDSHVNNPDYQRV